MTDNSGQQSTSKVSYHSLQRKPWDKNRFLPLLTGLACLLVIIPGSYLLKAYGPDIMFNFTPSMPKGLYVVTPVTASHLFHKGEVIVYPVPKHVEGVVYGRKYLPVAMPLLKPIAAMAGDTVCIKSHKLTINGRGTDQVFDSDSNGEPVPYKEGCTTLKDDELFPVSTYYTRSFDGRYHGVIRKQDVIGIATPWLMFPLGW